MKMQKTPFNKKDGGFFNSLTGAQQTVAEMRRKTGITSAREKMNELRDKVLKKKKKKKKKSKSGTKKYF